MASCLPDGDQGNDFLCSSLIPFITSSTHELKFARFSFKCRFCVMPNSLTEAAFQQPERRLTLFLLFPRCWEMTLLQQKFVFGFQFRIRVVSSGSFGSPSQIEANSESQGGVQGVKLFVPTRWRFLEPWLTKKIPSLLVGLSNRRWQFRFVQVASALLPIGRETLVFPARIVRRSWRSTR